MLYSTDASIFEIQPKQVLIPETTAQWVEQIQQQLYQGESITLRGGGTSLAGQAIGEGTLFDTSKYLTRVIEYRPAQKTVKVEPGLVIDELNQRLAFDDLIFPVDISTSNRATLGGMLGNNAAGSYSVHYGTTRDWVESVDVVLADGSSVCFEPLTSQQLEIKQTQSDLEGNIYRQMLALLANYQKVILDAAPDESIIRRNTGYALDVLVRDYQPFNPVGKPFNLAPLICGSEGTLCAVTAITLKLADKPKHRQLICAHFDSIQHALDIVSPLLVFKPAAVELIDQATLACTAHNAEQMANRFWIVDEPAAVLVVEVFADSAESLKTHVLECQAWLQKQGAYAAPLIPNHQAPRVWALRKAGLGLLMGKRTRKKAVAVIEDAAVPVKYLGAFYQDVSSLLASFQLNAVYYGHASVGLIHIRPELDLADVNSRAMLVKIAQDFAGLVHRYRGALSGEHGDGRLRAPFLPQQVGEKVYGIWQEVKTLFDPQHQFNPGVIFSKDLMTYGWRADRQPVQKLSTGFDWRGDISLMDAVEKCNGAGACRKTSGLMCPSYQVSREEAFSTRGRSNLLRRALTEPDPISALGYHDLQHALSHCLACKACKTECPASVDMARLKAEVSYQLKPAKIVAWSLRRQKKLMVWAQNHPKVLDWLQNLGISRQALGMDVRRPLPKMGDFDLEAWWKAQPLNSIQNAQKVWVLVDLYSHYQEPEVGKATLQSLVKLGLDVRAVFMEASPRALISQGLLNEAASELARLVKVLSHVQLEDYVVGIEPSETLTWRDEAKDLLPKIANAFNYQQVMLYEELLLDLIKQQRFPRLASSEKTLWLHVHCHQKSLGNSNDVNKVLAQIPGLVVKTMQTGCCGMAGDFGYKHYDMSLKIAQQALLPILAQASEGDWVVATGLSCRQQITDLANRNAIHLAQLMVQLLPNNYEGVNA